MPKGKAIGTKGSKASIREVPGGQKVADDLFDDLTVGGTPVHVGLWSIIRDVEEFFPKHDGTAIRQEVLKLLRELLLAKEIKAGFPVKNGKFHSLRVVPEKVLARIEAEWTPGRRPTIGEGLWFTRARKTCRSLESYVRKYGVKEGTDMYRRLQREAGLASSHAQPKKRLQAKNR